MSGEQVEVEVEEQGRAGSGGAAPPPPCAVLGPDGFSPVRYLWGLMRIRDGSGAEAARRPTPPPVMRCSRRVKWTF